MEIRILGPLEVWADGRLLPVHGPKQRRVLAALALARGRVVPVNHLIDTVWDCDPPTTARRQVQNAVSMLRQTSLGAVISAQAPGYLLRLDSAALDVVRFDECVARAIHAREAGNRPEALEQLQVGLALWRGPALAGVDGAVVGAAAAQLAETRLSAIVAKTELELELGLQATVVAEMTALVEEHPLHEQLVGLLMLALYRCGRQTDALLAYRATRSRLADELGLDPGPELTRLHERILCADPGLEPPSPTALVQPPKSLRLARHLPYEVLDFTGRDAEVARLSDLAETAVAGVMIGVIDGMAGVGKTALAVHVAHRLSDRFPDVQLFVDLHGHTPGRDPMDVAAALEMLLRALGVQAKDIPPTLSERAACWRAETARHRLLLVLDNAANAAQVRPLIPGTPGCLVLVTSRRRLATLEGAHTLSLPGLPVSDAITMFARIADMHGKSAEPAELNEVVELCGRLPLALRIAAARLRHNSSWSLTDLLASLRDDRNRLATLQIDDLDVAAAFASSYRRLDNDQQRLFCLAGLHPGNHFEMHAAAALLGLPPAQVRPLADALISANLLTARAPQRYTLHDLLKAHARQTAESAHSRVDRDAALTRLADYYLHTAAAAMTVAWPHEAHLRPACHASTDVVFVTASEALDWLDTERANLLAIAGQRGFHYATPLSAILGRYLDNNGHYPDALVLHTAALNAARREGDHAGLAAAHRHLGVITMRLGRYDDALAHNTAAHDAYAIVGDRAGQGRTLNTRAVVHHMRGELHTAMEYYTRALSHYQASGDRSGEGDVHSNLCSLNTRMGRYQAAIDHSQQAITLYREVGNHFGLAAPLHNLGRNLLRLDRNDEAARVFEEAARLSHDSGDRSAQAVILASLAEIHERADQLDQALHYLRQALTLAQAIGNLDRQIFVLNKLGVVHRRLGRHHDALAHLRQALELARNIGTRLGQIDALTGLAALAEAGHRTTEALDHCTAALVLANDQGDPYNRAEIHDHLGRLHHRHSDQEQARHHWRQAAAIFTELGLPQADHIRTRLADC